MGMIAGKEQEKSQLAKKICELSARATTCSNLHHPRTNRPPFINWYLVLKVDENADVCSIRKQYHRLALQLHPDKNSNSKAETAFKLVSEAYFCLSDGARRAAFDTDKKSICCTNCNPNFCKKTDPPLPSNTHTHAQETSRNSRIDTRMRELRAKLTKEATVIKKCLMANAASRKESTNSNGRSSQKESPVFDPTNYHQKSYPRHRSSSHSMLEDLRASLKLGNRSLHDLASKDYPVFQCRTERVSSMSRCASMRDH